MDCTYSWRKTKPYLFSQSKWPWLNVHLLLLLLSLGRHDIWQPSHCQELWQSNRENSRLLPIWTLNFAEKIYMRMPSLRLCRRTWRDWSSTRKWIGKFIILGANSYLDCQVTIFLSLRSPYNICDSAQHKRVWDGRILIFDFFFSRLIKYCCHR